MVAPLTIGGGITFGGGISAGLNVEVPVLMLSLDAGNSASYPGSGATWTDTVSAIPFTLNNGVTYNSGNGGSLIFDPTLSQYASSTSGVGTLDTWSIEAWHYYAGTNTAGGPCIVTEIWPEPNNQINYALGSLSLYTPVIQAGFYHDVNWYSTPSSVTLTAGNWYQIVGTYDGTTLNLYINNSLAGSTLATYSPTSGNQGLFLMKRWDTVGSGATEYWGGNLGIVKIYNGNIGSSGVLASWNANKSRFGL